MAYNFTAIDYGSGVNFQMVTGINDAGTMVGYFGGGGPDLSVSFVWLPTTNGAGQFSTLGNPTPGSQVRLHALNNGPTVTAVGASLSGSVAGAVSVVAAPPATVASAGVAAPSPGSNPRLLGINDARREVGFYVLNAGAANQRDVAASVSGASLVGLADTLVSSAPTVVSSIATGIDNAGDIVGTVTTVANGGGAANAQGFVLLAGSTVTATAVSVPGAVGTELLAVNNQGQAAGDYVDAGGVRHGFVYDMASKTFTTVDATGVPGTVVATVIDGINDQGALAGYYVDSSGVTHGLLAALQGPPQVVVNPTAGSAVGLIKGSAGVLLSSTNTNTVTLFDPGYGHATLSANAAPDTINVLGASDTVVANGSAANYTVNDAAGADAVIYLGAGRNTVSSGLGSDVNTGTGADSIMANGSIVFAGAASVAATTILASPTISAANTIVGGAGSTLVTGLGSIAGTLIFGGTGTTVVQFNSSTVIGAATMVGGTGTNYFVAGAGGGLLFGGTGGNNYLTGTSIRSGTGGTPPGNLAATTIVTEDAPTTVTAYAGSVFLTGSHDQVVISGIAASVGNLSLVGSQSSGDDTYVLGTNGAKDLVFEGSGDDTVFFGNAGNAQVVAGGGAEKYYLASNVVSGSDTIFGFKPGVDQVLLQNYDPIAVDRAVRAIAPAPGGSSVIHLNGVTIEFYGVGGLTTQSFLPG